MPSQIDVYVRRIKDGKLIAVPEYTLSDTLKQGFELASVDVPPKNLEEANPDVKTDVFECPICGRTFEKLKGLTIHKAKHK